VLTKIEEGRIRSKRNLDQFRALPETSVARVQLLDEHLHIENRKFLFLGDDDLTYVAAGIVGGATELVVVGIDRDTLECIKAISDQEAWKKCGAFQLIKHPAYAIGCSSG
jgi:predicted methyltransferase